MRMCSSSGFEEPVEFIEALALLKPFKAFLWPQ